jgi:outer membrane biosynthesis protein TonB
MDATNTTFTGYPVFEPSKQELKKSRRRGAVIFAVVVALHSTIAVELLNASKDAPKKPPKIMEVAMVTLPKPKPPEPPKPEVKPPEPPKPVVKKEVVKPKPIVKPVPVKKITPPKPVLQPKILTTTSENAEVSIPKFEAAPVYTPPVPVQTVAKSAPQATTSSQSSESGASSGGNCENCSSIEKRLQRRYARRNFSGSVSFMFTIGEDGTVKNATFKNADPADMFDEEVISEIKESLMEMEFDPKIVNGKAVSFKGTKTIKFQPAR